MAGYTRQSTFADGDTITAALFNNEYNQLLNAFSNTGGHKHDGTANEGPVIGLIGDAGETAPNNKVLIDTTNNYIEFYVQVSGSPVQQLYIADGAIVPVTDNDIDLGTSSLQFKDLYINGTANIDSLVLATGSTVTAVLDEDDLSSDSATSLVTQQSVKAYIDAQVTAQDLDFLGDSGGALSIDLDSESLTIAGGTGLDTVGSGNTVTVNIDATVATLTGSQTLTNKTIDVDNNTVSNIEVDNFKASAIVLESEGIGSNDNDTSLPTSAAVKDYVDTQITAEDLDITTDSGTIAIDLDSETLTVSGGTGLDSSATGNAVTLAIDSTVTTLTGTQTLTNKTLTSPDVNTPDIDGGTIDGATIATSDVTVGAGKTLDVSAGTLTLADNQISGDKVEGGTIAATTITDLTFGSLNDGTITATAFVDEDNMASNSATLIPTQQSVKAYVDTTVAATNEVVEDTTPQLGGDLDLNSSDITGTGDINITGTIQSSGNITGTLATAAQPNITSVGTLTGLTTTGNLVIGTEDNNSAILEINGGATGNAEGGEIRLDIAADYDGTYEFYRLDVSQDDFRIGRQGQTDFTLFSDGTAQFFGNVAATLSTAAQPNITSVGTLSGLTVSGDLLVDTNTLFVDSSEDVVGINTTSNLNQTLNVLGTSSDTIDETTGVVKFEATGGNGLLFGTQSSSPFRSYIQSAYTVDTSLAQYDLLLNPLGGNVGIGTSSPDEKLDVEGNLRLESTSSNGTYVSIRNGATNGRAYRIGSNFVSGAGELAIYDDTAGAERLRIDSSGNLLVGTTNTTLYSATSGGGIYSVPNGSTTIARQSTGSTQPLLILNETGVDGTLQEFRKDGSTVGSIGTVGGDLAIYSTSSSHAGLRFLVNGILPTNNAGTINDNTVDLGGASNRFKDLYLSGTVNDLTLAAGNIETNTSNNLSINTPNSLRINIDSNNSATDQIFVIGHNQTAVDNNNALMTVLESGNVGIGTSNPSVPLQINHGSSSVGLYILGGYNYQAKFESSDAEAAIVIEDSNSGTDYNRIGVITNDMAFTTNNSERMRIDSSGRVGIGTTSPQTSTKGLHVVHDATEGTPSFPLGEVIIAQRNFNSSQGCDIAIIGGSASHSSVNFGDKDDSDVGKIQYDHNANAMRFYSNATERMRIDSSGNLLVGKTVYNNDDNGAAFSNTGTSWITGTSYTPFGVNRKNTDGTLIQFTNDQAGCGTISCSGSSTAYNTSSDARLKDVTGSARGLEVINELNPVSYNWKADGQADEGLIAQEVLDIVPNAVSGSEEDMYQMDYSKLVVHLVAGMKEQQTQIDALQSEINNLKGE